MAKAVVTLEDEGEGVRIHVTFGGEDGTTLDADSAAHRAAVAMLTAVSDPEDYETAGRTVQ